MWKIFFKTFSDAVTHQHKISSNSKLGKTTLLGDGERELNTREGAADQRNKINYRNPN